MSQIGYNAIVHRTFALAPIVLAAACATTQGNEGPLIDQLRIEGAKKIPAGDLEKKILTTQSGFFPDWMPLLGDPQHFEPNAWQADLRRIERYYQAQGYYSAKVLADEI